MAKRIISFLIVPILAISLVTTALASADSLDNFRRVDTYTCGQFIDVNSSEWYAMYVQADVEYGLLCGTSDTDFSPDGSLTVAEAIKIAVCLNSVYSTGKITDKKGAPWYKPYVDDALKKGIINAPFDDYNRPITRAEFAKIIVSAMPGNAFSQINNIADNGVPDVDLTDSFGHDVYILYRAGILTGCDSFGTFRPYSAISRAEAAAIIARAADTGFRKSLQLPSGMPSEDIYTKCSSAVFYMERYDIDGHLMGIGSGFFISRDGLAITNYHTIDGVASAFIITADGTTYSVKGLCGYDKQADIAILQIDGNGFSYLALGDSDTLDVGTDIYAIGSPLGLLNTISDGIIANTNQIINGTDFIQFSAPISIGSGGGPVLNTVGEVIGVSCLTVSSGQLLNFAVPINKVNALSRTDCVSLVSIIFANTVSTVYYTGYYSIPDYGLFVGALPYDIRLDAITAVITYYYDLSDIIVGDDIAVDAYVEKLVENGFVWQSSYISDAGYTTNVYFNSDTQFSVHFGLDMLDGVVCRFVAIY